MNIKLAEFVQANMDDIVSRWLVSLKDERDERSFQVLSEEVTQQTSMEFAELMLANLSESHADYESRLAEFSEKVVRLGWSITFVTKAIDQFAQSIYQKAEEEQFIQKSNLRAYLEVFSNWINPMRDSIISAYSKTWERTVSLQKIALQELSASLIPVFEKVSVMPLVGTIDTERARLIMENLLQGIVKHRAEVVLLDITGVPVVDTMVAHHIIQAADAVRLVGAKCMLVGIRPEIAQTIVTLGINLNDFTTTSTLQRGVEQALAWTNRKIVEVESE